VSSTGYRCQCHIQFNVTVFMHEVTIQRCPSYVADLIAFCRLDPQRRSAFSIHPCSYNPTNNLLIWDDVHSLSAVHTFGTVCGASLHTITSKPAFHRASKTHFYNLAFFPDFSHRIFYYIFCIDCNAQSVNFRRNAHYE